jgi:Uri superfamily endonuclease
VKGIYILLIQLNHDSDIKIGALGKLHFPKGFYAYVGSAQTNLEQRIKRHLNKEKCRFWHIDHLLDNPATITINAFYKEADKKQECAIASEISQQNHAIPHFGCSDCNCRSHLHHIQKLETLTKIIHDKQFVEFNLLAFS